MFELEIVEGPDGLAAWRERWDGLLAEGATRAVYLTPEWFLSWWNGFGAGNRMHVVLLLDRGGALAGIAPLMVAQRRYRTFSLRNLCFIANGHSPAADLIVGRGRAEEAARAIVGHAAQFRGWDLVRLQKMSTRSETFGFVAGCLPDAGPRYRICDGRATPYVPIETGWDEFLAQRSPKFRKVLRNTVNRAAKMGDVAVERVAIEREDRDALETMAAVSSRSWKRVQGSDLSSGAGTLEFYRSLMRTMGPKGWLRLWVLRVEGSVVAFEFHLVYAGTVYPLWADYDASFAGYSPGRLLEFHILRTLFEERQATEYNSCGNAYPYLLNWTASTYQLRTAELFSGRLASRVAYWGHRVGPVLRRVLADRRSQR